MMRTIILDGLLRMYRDQKVDAYYSESLHRNYSARYYTFISIVVFLAVSSIAVPFVLRYV